MMVYTIRHRCTNAVLYEAEAGLATLAFPGSAITDIRETP